MTEDTAPLSADLDLIQRIIPHRYPFLLVDKVRDIYLNKSCVGIKNVTFNEPQFQGHFPGMPIFPGVMIIEAMAQAAGIMGFKMMDLKPSDGTLYYFVGSDKLRFRQPVVPGDQLILEAKYLSNKRSIWKFECKASVDGKEVCSAEIICAERKL